MRPDFSFYHYNPPGPIGAAYIEATGPIEFIMGPAGSGKTTASVFKGPYWTMKHMPRCRDGVIRAKGCVLRDNYRRLYETAIKSWWRFFPADFPGSEWTGGQDRPAHHKLRFRTPTGQRVELDVDFFAVGDVAIEEMLRGYEASWAWLNEVDLMNERVPGFMFSRLGRYPARELLDIPAGLELPRIVFADLNPPDTRHWIYRTCIAEPLPGFRLWRQPSGLSEQAENRQGVPRAYYEQQALVMDEWDRRRFIDGEFGYARDGKPIYPQFNHAIHVAATPLEPAGELPLGIGLDAGLSPAAAIVQPMPNGQVRVLEEICSEHGTGPERFSEAILGRLAARFRGCPIGWVFGDPSAFYGVDRQAGELSFMEIVGRALGKMVLPAPSNEPAIRWEAVRGSLVRMIDGRHPGILLDPRCLTLIAGFVAEYRFRKQRQGATEVFADRADKNEASHVHDGLQYILLGLKGRAAVVEDAAALGRPGKPPPLIPAPGATAHFDAWAV